MAGSFIDIKEEASPTKKLASQTLTRGVDTVHQEEIVIGDGTNDGTILGRAATPLRVDPTGTTAQPITDNAGSVTVDALDLDIRNLTPASDEVKVTGAAADGAAVAGNPVLVAGQDGTNAQSLKTDANGELQVDVLTQPALSHTTDSVRIGDGTDLALVTAGGALLVEASQPTAANFNAEVQGDAAHDAVVSGNPVLLAAYAETPDDSAPANQVSAEGDATRVAVDRDGAVYTHPHPPRIWHVAAEHVTAQTDTTVKAAPGAGLSLYVTDIVIVCNAAVTVTLEEGTTTLKFKYYGGGQGDGIAKQFIVPMKLTANTALTVTTSAAVSVFVLVNGYTGP